VSDRPWNPVAGTLVLPQQPGAALRNGTAARVPLLVGGTRDEMRAFVSGETVTAEVYRTMVVETFGDHADAVLSAYPVTDYESPAVALATMLGDWGGSIGACPVLRTAAAAAGRQPVYAYEFTEESGQVDENGFPMGSYHGQDVPYLFDLDTVWDPYPELTEEQWRMSATMIDYWSTFARTGNPNGPGRPRWSSFDRSGTVLGLSTGGIAPTPSATDHRCGLWAGLPR
jgi:para-nitrobenzyl esterase